MAKNRLRANLIGSPNGEEAYAMGGNGNVVTDIAAAGFQGYMPDLENWSSMQYRTPRNLIPIVLEVPMLFNFLPGSAKYIAAIRAMYEQHATNISGLVHGSEMETDEVEIGGTGEFMEAPTDIKGMRSSLSVSWRSLRGDPYKRLRNVWLAAGVMDSRTKFPLISKYIANEADRKNAIMTLPWYTATIAFIEPSVDGNSCEYCWIGSNIMPKQDGTTEGIRDLSSGQSIPEESIDHTGFFECTDQTRVVGSELLEIITSTSINPNDRKAHIEEIAANVAARVNTGYAASGSKL